MENNLESLIAKNIEWIAMVVIIVYFIMVYLYLKKLEDTSISMY